MKIVLSKDKMKQIKGGRNAENCKKIQALANNAQVSGEWGDLEWDLWADMYDYACSY